MTLVLGLAAALLGSTVLLRKRHAARGTYATAFGWALLLFGLARVFRSEQFGGLVDREALGLTGLHNVATLLGMTAGAAGAIPLLCIGAVITGGTPPRWPVVVGGGGVVTAGMAATFASTELSVIPSTFISRDIPVTAGVALYWAFFLSPIFVAATYIAVNAGRLLRWTAPGPWRLLLGFVALGGVFGSLYAAHKVVVLAATVFGSGDALLRTAPGITLSLGFLAIGGFASAMVVWLFERLPRQVRRYRAMRLHQNAWLAARRSTDRYLLEPQRTVPSTRRAAWRASRRSVTERQMRVEIADSSFSSESARIDQP